MPWHVPGCGQGVPVTSHPLSPHLRCCWSFSETFGLQVGNGPHETLDMGLYIKTTQYTNARYCTGPLQDLRVSHVEEKRMFRPRSEGNRPFTSAQTITVKMIRTLDSPSSPVGATRDPSVVGGSQAAAKSPAPWAVESAPAAHWGDIKSHEARGEWRNPDAPFS